MSTTALAFGIVGFLFGGLVVSGAAALADGEPTDGSPPMSQMAEDLEDKKGDDFDAAFIASMIEHHQGAIDMAELAAGRAEHDEIKKLSVEIIESQEGEIAEMEQWRRQWGYSEDSGDGGHSTH